MLPDLRYAVRTLAASPTFTLVAILSLAIGIGVNTTIFSAVNAVLLRPLPVERPGDLVDIYTAGVSDYSTSSWPDFEDLRRSATVFSGLLGHSLMFANVSRDGQSRIVMGEVVTANYFDLLGVRAAVGRTFVPGEDAVPGGNRLAILGHGFWHREFGASPSAIGQTVRLRGLDYTVIGVAPAAFTGMMPGFAPDLWIPASMVDEVEPVGIQDVVPSPTGRTRLERRGQRWMFVKGRLKPGVSMAQASAEVAAVMAGLERAHPATNRNRRALLVASHAVRIHPFVDGALVPGAALLMAAVGLVLIIACANVANMLLARATTRRRELAIRLAIGASRARIVRQLLTESLLLGLAGGAGGLVAARWLTGLLLAVQPPLPIALSLDLRSDWRVFGFATALSAASAVAFGLVPALRAARPDLVAALQSEAALVTPGRRVALRHVLVVAQVAVCFVLLVTGALLLRSLAAARTTDVGFDPRGLALATVDLGMHRYDAARARHFYDIALERIAGLPGVASAALVERLPFSPNPHTQAFFIEGRTYQPDDRGAITDVTRVNAGYFRTLGLAFLDGRNFDERDTASSPGVVIVNRTLARRYWPGERAVGKRVRTRGVDGPVFEVIGVVGDHRVRTIGEAPRPFAHFAWTQGFNPSATLLARGAASAAPLVAGMRQALLTLEPDLVFLENQSMEASMATTLFPVRLGAAVVGTAGLIALALAAVGLYGVLAFSVGSRTREIGMRIALGARPGVVLRMIVRQGMALSAAGIGIGVLMALAGTRVLSGLLYGVGAVDPASFAGAALLLILVSAAANWVPARRASRVDPLVALRAN
ncbi:MAG TPA: ABC transporter permease [Vicinamibacterales bacterium]|nr:ABC transporter permease [Vicinamibacterales bacterium]